MHFPRLHAAVAPVAAALWLVVAPASASAQTANTVERHHADLIRETTRLYPDIDALYRHLHAHPELAFEERQTAARLATEMRALGFEVTEGIGRTGVVAMLRNGPGPLVLVRTELDALPMEEKTGLPYASTARAQSGGRESFVTHSCGHDIHMAAWVGTARALLSRKEHWRGTLMFVAQPAEEIVRGAKAMLAEGLFTRFGKPDFAFALHSGPIPHGMIGYNTGAMTSNSDGLEITFKGRGSHGSTPDKSIDPIVAAARFVTDVQAVVSREKDPQEFGVVTIGAFQSGTVGNIIPDSALVRGTIRSYKSAVRERMLAGVRRTAEASAMMSGAPAPDIALTEGGAAVVNNEALVLRTVSVFNAAFGARNVIAVPPSPASEDFSAYLNEGVPGMFFMVGVYDPATVAESRRPGGKPLPINHSPFYAPVPEPTLKHSIQAMSLAVLNVLGTP